MKKVACLHGHHSNVALVDDAFSQWKVELAHYVDPGLLLQSANSQPPTRGEAEAKLDSQLSWMQASTPDAIVITCTQYAATLTSEHESERDTPIFTIDGPFLEEAARRSGKQTILFTNPATVKPTMDRLWQQAALHRCTPQISIHLIDGAFSLIMENKQQAYQEILWETMLTLSHEDTILSVAQLSMAPAARQFSQEKGIFISDPLQSLTDKIVQTLPLSPASF
ncbi:hypothetical protein [Brevibacillus nitrificans]|uniref:hypothetical protein n=1 Tax=Brevibacillus nitrificans TaxID=651560 RepID=UPI00262C0AA8|nr:hypothetical protein [Brevibacillus nitrificans]MED1792694.1 hypothetical protein [Brevibacillus nitrificans]